MAGKTGEQRIINGLEYWVSQIYCCLHHFERSAQVSEANIATFVVIQDQRSRP